MTKKLAEYDNAGLVQLVVELYARMGMSNSDTFDAPYKEAKEELLKRIATPPPQGLADGDLGVYENFVAATSAAPQTDAVQKWEYKRVKGYAPHFQLESLGDDGWQLCAIDRDKTLDTEQVFYFKRPKQNK